MQKFPQIRKGRRVICAQAAGRQRNGSESTRCIGQKKEFVRSGEKGMPFAFTWLDWNMPVVVKDGRIEGRAGRVAHKAGYSRHS
jgi:hypothetical protein